MCGRYYRRSDKQKIVGLWDKWKDTAGAVLESYALVTTEPNEDEDDPRKPSRRQLAQQRPRNAERRVILRWGVRWRLFDACSIGCSFFVIMEFPMRKAYRTLMLAILTLSAFPCIAQEVPLEPDFSGVFFRLEMRKLTPLERETAAIQGKASGFIVMSMRTVSEFPGAKSPIRFPSAQALDFIVRSPLASSTLDPNALYVLRKLNSKKKSRELVIMAGRVTPVGGSTKTDLAQGVLPVTFARYGASSLRMTTGPLPPGEYALSALYAQTVFCFGID
jgi:hypothetical protein